LAGYAFLLRGDLIPYIFKGVAPPPPEVGLFNIGPIEALGLTTFSINCGYGK